MAGQMSALLTCGTCGKQFHGDPDTVAALCPQCQDQGASNG